VSSSRRLVIYTISFVDQILAPEGADIHDDMKVYMTWTSFEGNVHNLTCLGNNLSFHCPLISKNEQVDVFSGELFIGANLTAIALKNDRHLGKDPLVWIQLGYGDDLPRENGFPLFPNVQLRATLAVTCRQTLTNTNLAALGFKKVGCDIQKIFSVSLIVCLVS